MVASRALWRNRSLRRLVLSNFCYFTAVWANTLVLTWLAYETTRSEFLVSVATAARFAPMLLGPLAGAYADRHNRTLVTLYAGGGAILAAALLAWLAGLPTVSYTAVILGALGLGLAEAPAETTRASLVADVVGPQDLSSANAMNAMAFSVTLMAGPAGGGAAIAALGASTALWGVIALYLISVALLLPLRHLPAPARPESESSSVAMILEGIRAVSRNPVALAVLIITFTSNLLVWPVQQVMLPIFAVENLSLGPAGLGYLLTACSVGAFLGSLVLALLGDFRHQGLVLVVGAAAWAIAWAVFAVTDRVPVAFAVLGLAGIFSSTLGAVRSTLLLLHAEPASYGRVMGLQTLAFSSIFLGALVLGSVAQRYGIIVATVGTCVVFVVSLGLLVVWKPELVKPSRLRAGEGEHSPPDQPALERSDGM